ncbi:DMT family transporter [Psychromonas sp. Urea-02u-13]|uniref:DMT family transporter n=1 Tax=Psychromonas sp. Urea-02u-13 TaxID=2058326 RepID=UPI000C337B56|nr:DMT family transporter [Psychromonas sp. Urea-02u-13]PKG37178.1 EamA family transporter [Psychromonas sp. Urea-02u-13]
MLFKNYLTLLAIGLIWGSQFIFQEFALVSFSPIWIGATRATIGAITLILICRSIGIKNSSRQWILFSVIGLLEAAIPFVLVPWGQQHLDSSIAAILMGTLPFYVLLLAPIFVKGVKINAANTISVIVGFSGLVVLFYPELSSGSGEINLVSSLAIIVAAVCFAIALLLLNRVRDEHPLIVARNVLSAASIQLIIIAFITTPFEYQATSTTAILSILYLGAICAGVVYYLYMMCIKNSGPVFTSMTNYIVPAVGVFIGALVTNESIKTNTWIALFIILFALFINQIMSKNLNLDNK